MWFKRVSLVGPRAPKALPGEMGPVAGLHEGLENRGLGFPLLGRNGIEDEGPGLPGHGVQQEGVPCRKPGGEDLEPGPDRCLDPRKIDHRYLFPDVLLVLVEQQLHHLAVVPVQPEGPARSKLRLYYLVAGLGRRGRALVHVGKFPPDKRRNQQRET